jgi:uncharacterized membrane protein YdfJ with MMPL/SSD domain
MTRDERDPERDEDLSRLLERWSAPVLPSGMDERVLTEYRRQAGAREPWWSRLFTASVRVPLPVAVGVLMLLIVTAALALRPDVTPPTAGTTGPQEPVRAARRGDVPVVSRTSLAGFQPVTEVTATVVPDQGETRQ